MEVDVTQLLDYAEQMGASVTKVRAEFKTIGDQVAQMGVQIARSILEANGSVVTGGLWRDITAHGTTVAGDTVTIRYGAGSKYPATWVEEGRGPVYARPGGKLRFQIKNSGPYIITRSVGPAPARPFLAPSARQLRPIAVRMLGDAILRAVR